jgi:hypothetical protein
MTVTPSVFTVNECGRIDDGRLEWATDTNVEHVINDMVGRVCNARTHAFVQLSVGERPSLYATSVFTQFLETH